MLPHQGQGASQAFEDAEALGYVFRSLASSSVSSPLSYEEINAALQRVFSIRYKRATYIQQLSRAGGLGEMRRKGLSLANGEEAPPLNPMKQQEYTWGYWGAERWEAEQKDWLA
jgi:salicylate hydroxylase